MNRTIILHPDGTQTTQDWPKGRPSLDWLQRAVGGYIERVPLWTTYVVDGKPRRCIVYANEYGKLQGQPYNPFATALWNYDSLVGDVLVVIGTRYFRGQ